MIWECGKPDLRTSPLTDKASQLLVLHLAEPGGLFFGKIEPETAVPGTLGIAKGETDLIY